MNETKAPPVAHPVPPTRTGRKRLTSSQRILLYAGSSTGMFIVTGIQAMCALALVIQGSWMFFLPVIFMCWFWRSGIRALHDELEAFAFHLEYVVLKRMAEELREKGQ